MNDRDIADRLSYRVEWSDEDDAYIGRCMELPSVAGHGDDPPQALAAVQEAASEAIAWMQEEGEAIPEPLGSSSFRGNILFRTTPDTHRELTVRAQAAGVSVNQFLNGLVERNLYTVSLDADIRALRASLSRAQSEVSHIERRLRTSAMTTVNVSAASSDTNATAGILQFHSGTPTPSRDDVEDQTAIAEG